MTTIIANLLLWPALAKSTCSSECYKFVCEATLQSTGAFQRIALLAQLSLYLNKAVLFVSRGAHEVAIILQC